MAYSAFKFEVHGDVRSVSCLFDASMQDSNLRLQNLGTAPLVLQVQGVNFRSGAVDHANKVGVVGHVENTSSGTVTGEVQGEKTPVSQMKVSRASEQARQRKELS